MKMIPSFLRHAALVFCVGTVGCTTEKKGHEETFEQMWEEVSATYGGFSLRNVDWDAAYDAYRPLVSDDMSDDEFFNVLTEMLSETDDGHVHLIAPGREEWFANRIYREKIGLARFDLELVRETYLGGDYETGDYGEYTLGELPNGATYLYLPFISSEVFILQEARARAEKSGGLVLDLRHNGGGDMTWAYYELEQWTSKDRPVSRSRTRNGPERNEFTAWYDWEIRGRGTDIDFPVKVLTDRYTISAGERTVMALATLENVSFIGEPTNGSIATSVGRELLNGWYLTIGTQEVFFPDGETTIEAIGFMPDTLIENDEADMARGIDAVLDEAMLQLEP